LVKTGQGGSGNPILFVKWGGFGGIVVRRRKKVGGGGGRPARTPPRASEKGPFWGIRKEIAPQVLLLVNRGSHPEREPSKEGGEGGFSVLEVKGRKISIKKMSKIED